jgi:CIC family chloride channel protein
MPEKASTRYNSQRPTSGKPSTPEAWFIHTLAAARDWLMGTRDLSSEGNLPPGGRLGDFTTNGRTVWISALGVGIGLLCALIAVALMDLIGLITNAAYFFRFSTKLVSPTNNTLGWLSVPIPIIGGLIIGLMARYGSERIRGHGIPEAMETILVGGSRIEPRLALLKPISSAISIGTGGPFGAEGPIILTGGAFGSLVAQFFNLTAAERKTLLVAGAAGGMAAVFNAPVSSVLLAVELLLFELKPRSLVPVALASATSTVLRHYLISPNPLFPLGPHPTLDVPSLSACLLVGFFAGLLSWVLTVGVYGAEDAFRRLPIHWMWWPAIGGIVIGIGGVFSPRSLGVGYDSIAAELSGSLPMHVLLGIIIVKAIIWCIGLGSGTSGGVLAPLLLMGGALGGIEAHFLPGGSVGLWSLIGMAAALGGTMRSPLTSIIFALELTHATDILLPLLISSSVAHLTTVLILKRSILTEKVARRGFHVTREYAVDPLEVLSAREVMATNVVSIQADLPLAALRRQLEAQQSGRTQRLYPVVDRSGNLVGVVTRTDLARAQEAGGEHCRVGDIMRTKVVVAYPDETLRTVAARMVTAGVWHLPVVSRENPRQIVGLISQRELLRARERLVEEERRRQRIFRLRIVTPLGRGSVAHQADKNLTTQPIPAGTTPGETLETGIVQEDGMARPISDGTRHDDPSTNDEHQGNSTATALKSQQE